MMKRIEALKKAGEIAGIVKKYAHLLREYNYDEEGCLGLYDGKKMKVFEVILFGSITRKCDDETVGDVDLLIIDNGVLSSMCFATISEDEDPYWTLNDNLGLFLEEIGDVLGGRVGDLLINDSDVDFHVLPLKFFRDKKFREEVKVRHHDPDFFKNVFTTAMRWRMGKQFVPVDVSYFERKYRVRLQDLKK